MPTLLFSIEAVSSRITGLWPIGPRGLSKCFSIQIIEIICYGFHGHQILNQFVLLNLDLCGVLC